ncbi:MULTISPECIES: class I SAM-dependent methyltransferase [Rhizobium/Agrobacterium group]|uniref:class I SAM-dependent methyltransferase n=1 Tax=Rhizobium/Agrobacterium group TaxID=227290 RepID=UPI0003F1CC9D|nr:MULTISPECIES: class I SAM-dependent methyltransferase [Rhizobium/Agrobacterium group]AHK00915.1 methyltransferase [Agrobacterium tumefaciens LBA4213 (Ach5)]AKC06736.1 methyltransferase [Agrobacterium tumefaciens]AYM15642.1 methyltransferase [Agrobacterium tumefaciens]AYM66877.1 methyltransferase [Agrobacterium tumefaciens]NIB54476.1 class I SAM-dependent methyltransferase [Agrobacterium tumefaciens]
MKQNIYDDPQFFERYSAMPRSLEGLRQAGEWHELRAMLPTLKDKTVLDLGCGFGWHCRHAVEQGAAHVVGVDLSENMLRRAAEINGGPGIEYRRAAIEDIDFAPESFDLVLSSLALHYVRDPDTAFARVFSVLKSGGDFVFSIEHPVFTALDKQDWFYDEDGEILHWPLDNYQNEGVRHSNWMADDVVKYHRTVSGILNALLTSGFAITRLAEPRPDPALLAERPEMKHEDRRPIFLIVGAKKP